ncbi:MAG: hypothetical protein WBZ48_06830 [Bacteroidota bacterium]
MARMIYNEHRTFIASNIGFIRFDIIALTAGMLIKLGLSCETMQVWVRC